MSGKDWMLHFADRTNLPDASVPGIPVIEIAGDQRVLIECHKGISAYSEQAVQIKVSYGKICVKGENLQLRQISRENLVISGRICGVELTRCGK